MDGGFQPSRDLASAGAVAQPKLRARVGLAFVRTLRPALYALLAASALLSFWAGGELFGRAPPPWSHSLAPALFGIFLVVFTVYRLTLVRARRYPAAVGLFQIGLGALLWALLLPGVRQNLSRGPQGQGDAVVELLSSGEPRMRAAGAELAGLRTGGQRYAAALIDRLGDDDAQVRAAAREALVHLAGTDPAAGLDDAQAAARWREEAARRGWIAP